MPLLSLSLSPSSLLFLIVSRSRLGPRWGWTARWPSWVSRGPGPASCSGRRGTGSSQPAASRSDTRHLSWCQQCDVWCVPGQEGSPDVTTGHWPRYLQGGGPWRRPLQVRHQTYVSWLMLWQVMTWLMTFYDTPNARCEVERDTEQPLAVVHTVEILGQ